MQSSSLLHHAAQERGNTCRMCGHRATRTVGNVDGYDLRACHVCEYAFVPAVTAESPPIPDMTCCRGADDTDTGPDFLDIALQRLAWRGPLHILDFASGQSHTAHTLRAQGHRVIAVDLAAPHDPHPDRLTGNLLTMDLPAEGFDLAYASQAFEHLPHPRPYLDELLRLTKKGGLVLIRTDMETAERDADLTAWRYVKPPQHCSFYRHQTFQRYLDGTRHRIVHRDAERVLVRRG